MPYLWAFPRYSRFDTSISTTAAPFGDLDASASTDEKTVGQTWSDPAVGQITSASGKYTDHHRIRLPSAIGLRTAATAPAHRCRPFALSPERRRWDRSSIARNHPRRATRLAETDDNCTAGILRVHEGEECVASGSRCHRTRWTQRFVDASRTSAISTAISGAYDITSTAATCRSSVGAPTKLFCAGADQPIFSSMAAVAIGTQEYVFVGTGSDLLPSAGVSTQYKLLGVLDTGRAAPRRSRSG